MINIGRSLNVTKRQCHLTITVTVIATRIVMCQHTHKTTAPLQLNRLQQATISWYWCSRSWSQAVVGQQDDRFIQQLPLLLTICQKSDCLCNCAHEWIRCNVDDHHCECLPVEEGVCHVAASEVALCPLPPWYCVKLSWNLYFRDFQHVFYLEKVNYHLGKDYFNLISPSI